MKTRDLMAIGIPPGTCAETAKQILQRVHSAKGSAAVAVADLRRVAASPADFSADDVYGELARQLIAHGATRPARPKHGHAPYRIWGSDLEPAAIQVGSVAAAEV